MGIVDMQLLNRRFFENHYSYSVYLDCDKRPPLQVSRLSDPGAPYLPLKIMNMTAIYVKPPPPLGTTQDLSIPREQREDGRRADRNSGDREADAKQEGSKVGSVCVWTTHAGIKRGDRTHADRVLLIQEYRWDGVRYVYNQYTFYIQRK